MAKCVLSCHFNIGSRQLIEHSLQMGSLRNHEKYTYIITLRKCFVTDCYFSVRYLIPQNQLNYFLFNGNFIQKDLPLGKREENKYEFSFCISSRYCLGVEFEIGCN